MRIWSACDGIRNAFVLGFAELLPFINVVVGRNAVAMMVPKFHRKRST
jgi:hypothetical protein